MCAAVFNWNVCFSIYFSKTEGSSLQSLHSQSLDCVWWSWWRCSVGAHTDVAHQLNAAKLTRNVWIKSLKCLKRFSTKAFEDLPLNLFPSIWSISVTLGQRLWVYRWEDRDQILPEGRLPIAYRDPLQRKDWCFEHRGNATWLWENSADCHSQHIKYSSLFSGCTLLNLTLYVRPLVPLLLPFWCSSRGCSGWLDGSNTFQESGVICF